LYKRRIIDCNIISKMNLITIYSDLNYILIHKQIQIENPKSEIKIKMDFQNPKLTPIFAA
jgi:hypothetical protein